MNIQHTGIPVPQPAVRHQQGHTELRVDSGIDTFEQQSCTEDFSLMQNLRELGNSFLGFISRKGRVDKNSVRFTSSVEVAATTYMQVRNAGTDVSGALLKDGAWKISYFPGASEAEHQFGSWCVLILGIDDFMVTRCESEKFVRELMKLFSKGNFRFNVKDLVQIAAEMGRTAPDRGIALKAVGMAFKAIELSPFTDSTLKNLAVKEYKMFEKAICSEVTKDSYKKIMARLENLANTQEQALSFFNAQEQKGGGVDVYSDEQTVAIDGIRIARRKDA